MITGHPFGYKFGRPTPYWDKGNQVRIGCSPEGWEVAISTGEGKFPLWVADPRVYYPTFSAAVEFIEENADKYGWENRSA